MGCSPWFIHVAPNLMNSFPATLLKFHCPALILKMPDCFQGTFGDQRHLSVIVKLILTIDQGQPPMNPISEEFEPEDDEIMVNVPVGTGRRFTIQGVR